MTKDEYVEYIKSAFITMSKKALIAGLSAQFPFLLNGFFAKALDMVAGYLVKLIAKYGEMQVFFWYTDFRVGEQSEEFIKAAMENHNIQKTGTPEEKKRAEENLISKFKPFAKFNQ